MIELIKYELRKILNWKGIYVGAAMFLIVYAIYIYSSAPSGFNNYRNVYKYYKNGEGIVTKEKILEAKQGIKEINKIYDAGIRLDDKNLGRKLLYRDINTVVYQSNNYMKIVRDLQMNKNKNENEKMEYKLLKKIGPLNSAFYVEGWKEIITFLWKIGCYFIIALGLVGISIIFPQEYSAGMSGLISSTKESRKKLIWAKISAAFIYVAGITIFFALINISTNYFIYGLSGWNAPLKNIYFYTSYDIKVWQFFIFQQFLFILVASAFGLFALMISILTHNSIISFSVSGIVFAVITTISSNIFGDKVTPGTFNFFISDFTRLKGICTSYLNIYSILGHPMLYEKSLIALIFIVLVILGIVSYLGCQKRNCN